MCMYIYIYNGIHQWELSREVSKSNFRQYGQMEKQRWEESEKRSKEERRSEKRKSQKKDDAGARKGRKVANTLYSQWFVVPEGRKVGSLKRRVRSHLGRWEMKNCGPLWREARLEVKMLKTLHARALLEVQMSKKVRAVAAQNAFPSQNVHHTSFGGLLEVEMRKTCTPLFSKPKV